MASISKKSIIILATLSLLLIGLAALFLKRDPKDSFVRNVSPEVVSASKLQTKKLPVFVYHYVEINQDKKDTTRDSLNINPYVFEQQMLTLQKAGYKFIWPSELDQFMEDTSDQKYVMITFDDGYATFYNQTYHFIKKNNLKVVNYLIYNKLGYLNYMTKDQVRDILKDGLVEFGSHTLDHPDLVYISRDEARRQIIDSKTLLEKEFGIKINSFCYPYGYYVPELIPFVEEAGYTNATTTKEGTILNRDRFFEIKRFRPGYLTGQDLLDKINKDSN